MTSRFTGTVQLIARHPSMDDPGPLAVGFDAEFADGEWAIARSGFDPIVLQAAGGAEVRISLARTAEGEFEPASGLLWVDVLLAFESSGLRWTLELRLSTEASNLRLLDPGPEPHSTVSGGRLQGDGSVQIAGRGVLEGSNYDGIPGTEVLLQLQGRLEPLPA